MNNNRQFQKNELGDNKTYSRCQKGNVSRKLSSQRKLLWADCLTEVLGENSNKWVSPISSASEGSEKIIKGILKKPWSSKLVTFEM